MPTFAYRAKKITGEEITGTEDTLNPNNLANALRRQGYILISYKQKKAGKSIFSFSFFYFFGGVSVVDKMIFAKNLAEMIGAGVSLTKGLDVLSRQTSNTHFKKVILILAEGIRKGKALSEVMSDFPKDFSSLFRAMVRAGEASGKLEESLKLIGNQLERDHDLRRKIRGAFMYPLIILCAMIIIGILMMIYVVPTLVATFQELGIQLPLTTRIMIAISGTLLNHGLLVGFGAIVFLMSVVTFLRGALGSHIAEFIFLKTPLISGLVKKMNSARTARTFGSLVGAGVDVVSALEVTEDVLQNRYFKTVLRKARNEIQKGDPISSVFIANAHLYPLLVGEMMQVGEETGKLSEMLFRLAEFYEGEVSAATQDLSTIIEPILMIVIGAIVGFFAISMITPLYSSLGNL